MSSWRDGLKETLWRRKENFLSSNHICWSVTNCPPGLLLLLDCLSYVAHCISFGTGLGEILSWKLLKLKSYVKHSQTFVGVTINIRWSKKKKHLNSWFSKRYIVGKELTSEAFLIQNAEIVFFTVSKNQIKKLAPFFTRLLSASIRDLVLSKQVLLRRSLWIIATCRVPFLHNSLHPMTSFF